MKLDARRAGKKPAPQLAQTTGDLATAKAAYEKGAKLHAQAKAAAVTERSAIYDQAFVALTEAMRDYRAYGNQKSR